MYIIRGPDVNFRDNISRDNISNTKGNFDMSKAKILIAEMNKGIAHDIRYLLEKENYSVVGLTASGSAAVKKAKSLQPDLMFVGVQLKGKIDGIEVAARVRSNADIPVVFISSEMDNKVLPQALATKPAGYLVTPFEERDVVSVVEVALLKAELIRRMKERESWLLTTMKSIGDGVVATDPEGRVVFMNPVAEAALGLKENDAFGKELAEICYIYGKSNDEITPVDPISIAMNEKKIIRLPEDIYLQAADGAEVPIQDSAAPIYDEDGKIMGVVFIFSDISKLKKTEETLKRRRDDLHTLNQERSDILAHLKDESGKLRETNIALEVLLRRRDKEKEIFAKEIRNNVSELIEPYLEKMRQGGLTGIQKDYLYMIEANMEKVVSPFRRGLLPNCERFTPTEFKVADMIKRGKSSKEIAKLFDMSSRTVETHRDNIRKKLGIKNRKTNLRETLLSII